MINFRSDDERKTSKKKAFWMEIAILMSRIEKSHVNYAMKAKMIYRTSKPVATIGSYWNILKLETYECDFYSLYSLKDYYILFSFLIGNVCNKLLQFNAIIPRGLTCCKDFTRH